MILTKDTRFQPAPFSRGITGASLSTRRNIRTRSASGLSGGLTMTLTTSSKDSSDLGLVSVFPQSNNSLTSNLMYTKTGRRVCSGWFVGQQNVFIAAARLLYCFDLTQDPSDPIDTMRIPGITKGRKPYALNIRLRSPAHGKLIERDCEEAAHAY